MVYTWTHVIGKHSWCEHGLMELTTPIVCGGGECERNPKKTSVVINAQPLTEAGLGKLNYCFIHKYASSDANAQKVKILKKFKVKLLLV